MLVVTQVGEKVTLGCQIPVSCPYIEDKENEDEDDDDEGWITPSNLKEKKASLAGKVAEDSRVEVACITTDFAMQNVLKQIGLNIIGANGMIIKVGF